MAFAIWQRFLTDEEGDILTSATITVRRESAGAPLADLKNDRDGLTNKGNPFTISAGDGGLAVFYAVGGAYRIDVSSGAFSATFRYVAIGTAAETDALEIPTPTPAQWTFNAGTSPSEPDSQGFKLNSADPETATELFISETQFTSDGVGTSAAAWLATLDDAGTSSARGVVEIFDPAFPTEVFHRYRVSGSVVDNGSWDTITLTWLSGVGDFTDAEEYSVVFWPAGPAGPLENVVEDTSPQLGGDLDANGFSIIMTPLGVSPTSNIILNTGGIPLSTGIHTVSVPAGAMYVPSTAGAAAATTELVASAPTNALRTLAFDPGTEEVAFIAIPMPKSWNGGTFTMEFLWTAASGTGSVVWGVRAAVFSEGDALEASFGTQVTVTDTLTTAGDMHVSDDTTAITPSGTPADDSTLFLRITREVADASDTLTTDALLMGVRLFINLDAANDE